MRALASCGPGGTSAAESWTSWPHVSERARGSERQGRRRRRDREGWCAGGRQARGARDEDDPGCGRPGDLAAIERGNPADRLTAQAVRAGEHRTRRGRGQRQRDDRLAVRVAGEGLPGGIDDRDDGLDRERDAGRCFRRLGQEAEPHRDRGRSLRPRDLDARAVVGGQDHVIGHAVLRAMRGAHLVQVPAVGVRSAGHVRACLVVGHEEARVPAHRDSPGRIHRGDKRGGRDSRLGCVDLVQARIDHVVAGPVVGAPAAPEHRVIPGVLLDRDGARLQRLGGVAGTPLGRHHDGHVVVEVNNLHCAGCRPGRAQHPDRRRRDAVGRPAGARRSGERRRRATWHGDGPGRGQDQRRSQHRDGRQATGPGDAMRSLTDRHSPTAPMPHLPAGSVAQGSTGTDAAGRSAGPLTHRTGTASSGPRTGGGPPTGARSPGDPGPGRAPPLRAASGDPRGSGCTAPLRRGGP